MRKDTEESRPRRDRVLPTRALPSHQCSARVGLLYLVALPNLLERSTLRNAHTGWSASFQIIEMDPLLMIMIILPNGCK